MSTILELILRAKDQNLSDVLRRGEKAIANFGKRSADVFKRANNAIVSSYNRLGVLAPLGIGVGFTAMAKHVMEFDGALRKMGRSGGWTREDIAGLRTEILDLTRTIPVTKDQFAEMARELSATGIPLAMIKSILPDVGKGAKAAGVDTGLYAGTLGELLDKYKVAASDLPALQDQIAAAMKMEDVRKNPEMLLQSIQSYSKLAALTKSFGMQNVTTFLAVQTQLMKTNQSVDGLYNGLMNLAGPEKQVLQATLKQHGIELFDATGAIKSIDELLPQFKKIRDEAAKYGKSTNVVASGLFGRAGIAMIAQSIMDNYDEIIKKQAELGKSGGNMGKDYNDAQESMSAKLTRFQNQIDHFNTTHMSTALKYLSGTLDYLNAHPIISKGLMTAILGVGGLIMLNKVIDAVKGINEFGRMGPDILKDRAGGGAWRNYGNQFGLAAKASLILGAAMFGWEIGKAIAKMLGIDKGEAGAKFYDWTHKGEAERNAQQDALWAKYAEAKKAGDREAMKSLLNQIKLTVNIDKSGRVTTDSNDMNTSIDVNRGDFGMLD